MGCFVPVSASSSGAVRAQGWRLWPGKLALSFAGSSQNAPAQALVPRVAEGRESQVDNEPSRQPTSVMWPCLWKQRPGLRSSWCICMQTCLCFSAWQGRWIQLGSAPAGTRFERAIFFFRRHGWRWEERVGFEPEETSFGPRIVPAGLRAAQTTSPWTYRRKPCVVWKIRVCRPRCWAMEVVVGRGRKGHDPEQLHMLWGLALTMQLLLVWTWTGFCLLVVVPAGGFNTWIWEGEKKRKCMC